MGNWIQTSAAGPQTGGGTYAPLLPASVAAAENASRRYIRTGDQVTITAIEVTPTRQADDRAEWFEVWFYDAHLAAWGASEGKWKIGDPITIWRPLWDSSWIGSGYKVRVTTGAAAGENNPASAIESSAFAISAIGNPAATVITGGGIGDLSYFLRDGIWWFVFTLSWDISASDAHFWTSKLTAQNGKYVGGTWTPSDREDGVERTVQEFVNDGALTRSLYVEWPNNGPDEEYPTVKLRFYDKSRRVSDNSGDGGWVAQTSAFGSSVGFLDVTPVAQEAAFPADRLKRTTIGGGLIVDSITGELRVPTAAAPVNRVTNATFASAIAGWTTLAGGSGSWSHDAAEGKSAAGSLKSSMLVGDGNLYKTQEVACAPGEVPTISAWYKTSAGAGDNAYILIQYLDASHADISGGYYQHTGPWGASTAWAQMSYTFAAAPALTAYVRIYIGVSGSATGTWWFDDVSFTVPAGFGLGTDPTGNLIFLPGDGLGDDGAGSVAVKLNDAAEMEFVGGKVSIKGVNFTKGFNGFDVGSAAIPKITVSPDGVPVGWIGKDTTSGYAGAWFKRCYIGGTSPSNAGIVADATGNVSISGSLIVGAVASATSAGSATTAVSALSAGTLSLNLNNIITIVNNSTNNGYVTSFYSILTTGSQPRIWITPEQIVFGNSSFGTLANISITSGRGFIQVANTTGGQVYLDGAGNVGATGVISATGGFVAGGNGGLTTTISYVKPGGATGTMTFTGGILTGIT